MLLPRPVVLASASPRRQELLRQLTPEFTVESADVDEAPLPGELPWQTAERLAQDKARTVSARHPNAIVIAGDTVVAVPEKGAYMQLAKPTSEANARDMLATLSGRMHLVISGVCILAPTIKRLFSVTTKVEFRTLSEEEIRTYVETGEPMDKAGAYAIQGGAAGFVAFCDGSLSNVIGFPVDEIRAELELIAVR